MTIPESNPEALTPALEDYIGTIYKLARQSGFTRVRDIAEARGVRPASVTQAMRRLEKMGLIRYERREFIGLTTSGEESAGRIYSRHQILLRFFTDFLGLPVHIAEKDACAMEHSLSGRTAESLAHLFEFMKDYPEAEDLFRQFRRFVQVDADHERRNS